MRKHAPFLFALLLVTAYPLAVYFGLSHFSGRTMGLIFVAFALIQATLRLQAGQRFRTFLAPVSALFALSVLSSILDDPRFMLALPVLISAILLVSFGSSLFRGRSMIERFARLQKADLSPDQVRHCRQATWVWSAFFVMNGATAACLALFFPIAWWTLYTGLIAYVIMGLLFAGEYILRKYRFRELGPGLPDRLLAALFRHG